MEVVGAILSILAVLAPLIIKAWIDRRTSRQPKDEYDLIDRELADAHASRDYTVVALRLQRLHEKSSRRAARKQADSGGQSGGMGGGI